MPLRTRFKAKIGWRDKTESPPPPAKTASPHGTASQPQDLRERLWNRAYDQAREDDSAAVEAYEKILSIWLSEQQNGVMGSQSSAISHQNEIAKDVVERRSQMQILVELGLSRTEKHARDTQKVGDGMQAVLTIKELVGKAVQASPQAAIAWVGVCFALEICMNPSTEASSNRQGIAYVVSRMEWYWNLSRLLLDENMSKECLEGSRLDLENAVTQLYAKLLLYQMRSVCYYHRNRFATWMRDLVKLEDWSGTLSDLQAAERALQQDCLQYNTIEIRNRLSTIADAAAAQQRKLDNIDSAIREQTTQQATFHKTDADASCIRALRTTDPRDDKVRIEAFKGGLLKGSYRWVLDNAAFQQWRNDSNGQLLWIKGDPGKGKTMLLCGIIDELQNTIGSTATISYFFCQATNVKINNATAVLRGLLYMLISRRPKLIKHVHQRYAEAGTSLFEDANAWVALTEIFVHVLQDLSLDTTTYMLIDGLDECSIDLSKLLSFIAKQSSAFPGVKWTVSSRNWPAIQEQLNGAGHKLSLELNAASVAAAVESFTNQRVDQLAKQKGYKPELRSAVLDKMRSNAEGTFLWVALACHSLQETRNWNVLEKLERLPPGLNSLYERMLEQIECEDVAETCLRVLAATAVLYRPATVSELVALVELPKACGDLDSVRDIIALCGSFLTLQEDTVYFVHQSANDYLNQQASDRIFTSGKQEINHAIYLRSMKAMHSTLHRNMYSLDSHGFLVNDLQRPDPDPLRASRYSCEHWIDHFCDSSPISTHHRADLQEGGSLATFIQTKYLYWLEALGLCRSLLKGVLSMAKLEGVIKEIADISEILDLVGDARRFMMSHKQAIMDAPLQTYMSALVFSPKRSLTKNHFEREAPSWLTIYPAMKDEWGACLQTLEGHTNWVRSVAFSHDSALLASASLDCTIKLWDVSSGDCLRTLTGHHMGVNSVAFSHDTESALLASGSSDETIKLWNTISGECLRTLTGHNDSVNSVAFSHDTESALLASGSDDATVRIWNTISGECLRTLAGHNGDVRSVTFSYDANQLASASEDTIKIWNLRDGCVQTFEGHDSTVTCVTFSRDSEWLASSSRDKTVKIWNRNSGECLQTLHHSEEVNGVTFSHDSVWLASASDDCKLTIWNAHNGAPLKVLGDHSDWVRFAVFSHNSTCIASAADDFTVKIWDMSSDSDLQIHDSHDGMVGFIQLSHDKTRLASTAVDGTVKIWDTSNGECLRTLEAHSGWASSVSFSHDSTWLATVWDVRMVGIWDTASGDCLNTFEAGSDIREVLFSDDNDSTLLAAATEDSTIKIWDTTTGNLLQTLIGHSEDVNNVAFSHDMTLLASASDDESIKIWDISSGDNIKTLQGHIDRVESVAFLDGSTQLASTSWEWKTKIWDAGSGDCLLTLEVGLPYTNYAQAKSILANEISNIVELASESRSDSTAAKQPHDLQHRHTGLTMDEDWIMHNSKRLLWIPPAYRSPCWVASGNVIAIGTLAGRVWMCKTNELPEP